MALKAEFKKIKLTLCSPNKRPLGILTNRTHKSCYNIKLRKKVNETHELSFDIASGGLIDHNSTELLVKLDFDYYIIKEVNISSSDSAMLSIVCESEPCELKGVVVGYAEDLIGVTPQEMWETVVRNCSIPNLINNRYEFVSDIVDAYRSLKMESEKSLFEYLVDIAQQFQAVFMFSTDSAGNITITMMVGEYDRKKVIKSGKDLKTLNINLSTTGIFTQLTPFGAINEETGMPINIMEVNGDKSYVENYDYYLSKGMTLDEIKNDPKCVQESIYNNTDIVNANDLLRVAREELARISAPVLSGAVDVLNIGCLEDYVTTTPVLNERIIFIDKVSKYNISSKVTEIEIDYDNPLKTKVSIGNIIQYSSTLKDVVQNSQTIDKVTSTEDGKPVLNASKVQGLIDGHIAKMKYTMLDSVTDVTDAVILFECSQLGSDLYGATALGSRGILISKEKALGGGWKWTTALDANGLSTNIINTIQLNASQIKGDMLRSNNQMTWINLNDGTFNFGDKIMFNGSKLFLDLADNDIATNSGVSGSLTQLEGVFNNKINVASAEIGKLKVSSAEIEKAVIDLAVITDAQIKNLEVVSLKVNTAEIDIAKINNIIAGNITGESGHLIHLTADNVVIDNAVIKDLIASNISVQDLIAGDISTNRFRIVSDSGKMVIADNTIQIKDNNRTRVQIGKDASNDYSMYVWDSTGRLMFDATGLKADGIKNKIIRDDMISDSANISGGKINITSLITEVNKDTNTQTIKSSKVQLDTVGQTLEVAFNSLKTQADGTKNLTENNTTQIGVVNGQINTLIKDTTIEEGGTAIKLKDKYTSLNQTVNGLSTKVNDFESTLTDIDGKVLEAITKSSEALQTADGFSNRVSYIENNYATTSSLTQTSDSIIAKFSQSGGYNLLKDSNLIKNTQFYWWHPNVGTVYQNRNYGFGFYTPIQQQCGLYQTVLLKANTNYTLSGILDAEGSTNGATLTADIGGVGHTANANGNNRISVTFNTGVNTSANIGVIHRGSHNHSGGFVVWVRELMLVEGSVALPWTPHPSEIYEGSTMIDASGVTVNNGALTIKNKAGTTVFEGDTNGDLILKGKVVNGLSGYSTTMDKGGVIFTTTGENVGCIRSTSYESNRHNNGVSIAIMGQGDYLDMGYTDASSLTDGAEFYSIIRITKTEHPETGNHAGIQLQRDIRVDNGRKLSLQSSTAYDHDIFSITNGYLGIFGDNGTKLGYKVGTQYFTAFEVLESADSQGCQAKIYGSLNMNGHNIKNVANYYYSTGDIMGAVKGNATRISNLNTFFESGWYACGSDCANAPESWGVVHHFKAFSGDFAQWFHGTSNKLYIRWYVNNNWTGWRAW